MPHSPFTVSPDADGFESIVLGDWATVALHESDGNGKAVLAVSNGIWQVGTLPQVPQELSQYLPSGDPRDWMTDVLAGLKAVRIAGGTEFRLESAEVLGGTAWNRDVKLANVPMTGAGDLVMTNGTPGYTFRATVVAANNTATGVAKAVCGTGGDATTLLFNDGANWAGTVVADGRIALTNLSDAVAAATVTFGSMEFAGDFPIRVWKQNGDFVSDRVNLNGLTPGVGGFRPVPQNGFRFQAGDTVTIGTWPEGAVPLDPKSGMAKKWRLVSEPAAEAGYVTVKAQFVPTGTIFSLR